MKQQGKFIIGDPIRLESYTSDWPTVKIHPGTYYRRIREIEATFEKILGVCAELDMGQYVLIRFSNRDDLTMFHRHHHEYI